jgi:hypothetical protein
MASRTERLAGTVAVGAVLALAALAGCGGSGGTTGGATAAGGGTTGAAAGGEPTGSGGSSKSPHDHAIEQRVQSRGIKGESPTAEAASTLAISAEDCARLAAATEARLHHALKHDSHPAPPLSKCRLDGRGATVNVYLDAAFAARQRYMNRMEETAQFGVPDQAKVPHPVTGVGAESAYNTYASWVPASGSLFAVRGNRWITVAYSVPGQDNARSREEAADLARLAFRLTAR